MVCGKVLLLQALLAGVALGQAPAGFTPFQNGFQPSPSFQPFQPLPALRQPGGARTVLGGFQPMRAAPFAPAPAPFAPAPAPFAPAPAATGPRTEVFGSGVESFKLVHHDQPAEVPAARSLPVIPAFQQPTTAAPVFEQPLPAVPAPAFAPAFAPAPALPRPVEQHDAQTFTRRPAEGAGQVIPFTKVNPSPVLRSRQQAVQQAVQQDQQEAARFEQENQRIQDAQQAQLDSLRLQQAQTADQFEQENSRIQLSQQSVRDNLRFQKPAQQQAQQVQQVQQEAPQQDAFSEVFDAPAAAAPRPAAHKVHRGRARHQEEPEPQQVSRVRQQSRRLPEAPAPAAPTPAAAAPALRAPIRVADVGDESVALEEQQAREQAENAHYTFASAIDDKLTDNAQVRQETRDGLNLAGLYSYSDGFFRRTVHYEADENGYRVTKEEVEPLGDGPQPNPAGTADVRAQISGTDFGYRITADDIREKTKDPVKQAALAPADAPEQRHRFAARA